MSAFGLTPRMQQLLAYLKRLEEAGQPAPTYDQMAAELGLRSKSGVHKLLENMEERGVVMRLPHRARTIRTGEGRSRTIVLNDDVQTIVRAGAKRLKTSPESLIRAAVLDYVRREAA